MREAKQLPNGQPYYRREKVSGMHYVPARMPSKKQVRRWRRMIRRKGLTPDQYLEQLQRKRWWIIRYSGQA